LIIETNDLKNPKLRFTVKGDVEKVADISAHVVKFVGEPEQDFKSVVKITPKKKYNFKITDVKTDSNNIKLFLNYNDNNKGYELSIKNIKKTEGEYFDAITLKTDSKYMPEIPIRVYGNIFKKIKPLN